MRQRKLPDEVLKDLEVAALLGKIHGREAGHRDSRNRYFAKIVVRDFTVSVGSLRPGGEQRAAARVHQDVLAAPNARPTEIFLGAIAFDGRLHDAFGFQHPALRNAIAEAEHRVLIEVAIDFSGIDLFRRRTLFQQRQAMRRDRRSVVSLAVGLDVLLHIRRREEFQVFDRSLQPLDHLFVVRSDHDLQNVVADGGRHDHVLLDAATRFEQEELVLREVRLAQPAQFFDAAIEFLIERLAEVSLRILLVASRGWNRRDRDLSVCWRRTGEFQDLDVSIARCREELAAVDARRAEARR